MAEYKDGEILTSENKIPTPDLPSEKELSVINNVYTRFTDMKKERDKIRHECDDRNIIEYVNDSVDQYNGIVSDELKATKEDWQSLI